MKTATLRSKINQVTGISFALVAILVIAAVWAYAAVQRKASERSLQLTLLKSSQAQVEQILPSFLLPEQQAGAKVIVERLKEQEELDQSKLLSENEKLPEGFDGCGFGQDPSACLAANGTSVGVLVPIIESGKTYGFLFKSKTIKTEALSGRAWRILLAILGTLLVSFLAILGIVARITSKEIPDALESLASWIESSLAEQRNAGAPNLKYTELNDLAGKITEILERHEKNREQATIGQITSGVMHDIKTPLHSMVTAVGLVAELSNNSPKRTSRLENLFRVASEKLPVIGSIVETTLDGTRKIDLRPQNFDLNQTVRRAVDLTFDLARLRGAQIDLDFACPHLVVQHDPTQLSRVLVNLIKNGIEAASTADRPRITVHVSHDGDGAKIRVEDNGHGLPSNSERVFRIFRSTKPHGSGLGLMISRKIVEAHRGTLRASHAEQSRGARFEVSLPGKEVS